MYKYRVIESQEGHFYPQFKSGWFSFWYYFTKDAVTTASMLERAMKTQDPLAAARFNNKEDAQSFSKRVQEKVVRYWQEQREAAIRRIEGIAIKNVYKEK